MSRSSRKKPLPPPVDEEAVSRVRAEVDRREALLAAYERHGPSWWAGRARPGASFGAFPGETLYVCRTKAGQVAVFGTAGKDPKGDLWLLPPAEARAWITLGERCDSLTSRGLDRRLRDRGPLGGNVPS